LQDASKALITAEGRVAAAEDKVTAFEFRAQSAEALLQEAKQALLQVEEAIRERLLNDNKHNVNRQIAKDLALL
jgi:hypothetical protein